MLAHAPHLAMTAAAAKPPQEKSHCEAGEQSRERKEETTPEATGVQVPGHSLHGVVESTHELGVVPVVPVVSVVVLVMLSWSLQAHTEKGLHIVHRRGAGGAQLGGLGEAHGEALGADGDHGLGTAAGERISLAVCKHAHLSLPNLSIRRPPHRMDNQLPLC